MAPIIFCKCSQCICTATVLIHTEEENTDGANNFQDISKTRNYSSSYENYEAQSTSSAVHQNEALGDSKSSLESIFFVLLVIFILICEQCLIILYTFHDSVLVSWKLYSEIKRNLELGRATSYTFSKQFGEVEVGLHFNVKKSLNKSNDKYFDDDLTKILSSLDSKRRGEIKQMASNQRHPNYSKM